MDDFQGKSACLNVSCVNMPILCAFAQVEIFMINHLNIHISGGKKKYYCPDDAKEQCITEAAGIVTLSCILQQIDS